MCWYLCSLISHLEATLRCEASSPSNAFQVFVSISYKFTTTLFLHPNRGKKNSEVIIDSGNKRVQPLLKCVGAFAVFKISHLEAWHFQLGSMITLLIHSNLNYDGDVNKHDL